MNISITKNGKALSKNLYTLDIKNKTFTSSEDGLVIDLDDSQWTFKTGHSCTFKTGSDCTFNTGGGCTFNTRSDCTFNTEYNCTFKTGRDCTFNTGSDCTFNTGSDCTFNTEYNCTFNTGDDCTFNVGNNCTLVCWWNESSYLLKKGKYELDEKNNLKEIKDSYIMLEGKKVYLSEETINNIKEGLK